MPWTTCAPDTWHRRIQRASTALSDLQDLPVQRTAQRALLTRIWELRHVVTPYDAAYVALAEALKVVLVTGDARLARAPGIRCEIETVPDMTA